MSSNGSGRRRRSNFDQVPADDGFRNYMANKIKLQKKQFGLQLPPPPQSQSPSPRSQSSPAASASAQATPPPTILKRSIHSTGGYGKVEDSPAKSVRFHVDTLDDNVKSNHNCASSDPKSISDVLDSLKQHHPTKRRRKRRGRKLSMSMKNHTNDTVACAYDTPKKDTESPIDSEQSTSPALGVLDVLDNLQKKHGSSSRRRRSSSSAKRRKYSHATAGGTQSSLESLDKVELNATESIERNRSTPSSNRGKMTPSLKRRRDSPRCLRSSVLEGLQSVDDHNAEEGTTVQSPIDTPNQTPPDSTVTSPSPANSLGKPNNRPDLFFYGVVILVNGYTNPDAETLKRLIQRHGGDLEKYETSRITHIIAEQLSTAKANIYKRQKKPTPVCTPNWIVESIEKQKLLPHADYLLKGVLDKNVFGSKKVKSYFGVQPKETGVHAGEGREDKNKCDEKIGGGDHEQMVEKEPEESVTGRPHRWQDKDPHEANHMFADAKTVGNDPK